MNIEKIQKILSFMQRHDPNGSWMEWYEEIKCAESSFDSDYVAGVLNDWYKDSNEVIYLGMIDIVNTI